MGLFDRIIVKYPLPLPLEVVDYLPDIYDKEFQTKDLENLLIDYILEEDGKLYEVRVEREWVDDDDSFLKGYFKAVKEEILPSNYYGIVNFYAYERLHQGTNKGMDVSIDYLAKFNDGQLVNLELFNYRIEDSSDDIKRTNDFYKEMEIKRNKWYNKYFLHTPPLVFIRRKIVNFFGKLHKLTGSIHTFFIRHL